MNGIFCLITGPTAVGKTTIVDALIRKIPDTARLVTTTTRPPRPGEIDGIDYHFVTRDDFIAARNRGAFLEWKETHGNFYGSSREALDELLLRFKIIFGILNPEGVRDAGHLFPPGAVSIFLAPGSYEELEARVMRERANDRDLDERLKQIHRDLMLAPYFNYIVLNHEGEAGFRKAVQEIAVIIEQYAP